MNYIIEGVNIKKECEEYSSRKKQNAKNTENKLKSLFLNPDYETKNFRVIEGVRICEQFENVKFYQRKKDGVIFRSCERNVKNKHVPVVVRKYCKVLSKVKYFDILS